VVSFKVVVEELLAETIVDVLLGSVMFVIRVMGPKRVVKNKRFVLQDLAASLGLRLSFVFWVNTGRFELGHLCERIHLD
jgi:membrane protein CcdC involved in cytochrome C biogenesis